MDYQILVNLYMLRTKKSLLVIGLTEILLQEVPLNAYWTVFKVEFPLIDLKFWTEAVQLQLLTLMNNVQINHASGGQLFLNDTGYTG